MSNTYTDEDIEHCTLTGRREILFQLRSLIKHSERVSVSFDEGRQSFLTVLIEVDEENNFLYFDIGGSEETNRAFLKNERCVFAGILEGIRIQFSGKKPQKISFKGEQVFAVPLPASLLRLQRREAYRLQLPSTKPYICRIRRGSSGEMALPLYDISIGGIGVHLTEHPAFAPMDLLENCWIDLRDSGILAVTLEVRYVQEKEIRAGKSIFHLGCRFVKLSPLNETLIQRFMARLEAERRALAAS